MSPNTHKLGWPHGSIVELDDGNIEYRKNGKRHPAFRVRVADIRAFSKRKPTRADKREIGASFLDEIVVLHLSGDRSIECAVDSGVAEKIEHCVRGLASFGIDEGSFTALVGAPRSVEANTRVDGLTDHERLRAAGVSGTVLSALRPGETVHAFIQGYPEDYSEKFSSMEACALACGDRVVLVTERMMAKDVREIPYDSISSVRHEMGVMFALVEITATGGATTRVNTVRPKRTAEEFVDFVRSQLGSTPQVGMIGSPASLSVELEKLAALRDRGDLNEAEFAAAKSKLLDR